MADKDSAELDGLDNKILYVLQYEFPIDANPYESIAKRLQTSEQEVLERVGRLKNSGYIRRLGASINSNALGFVSTLVALKVKDENITQVAKLVNGYTGVTHNYLRDGEYNMWFTAICPNQTDLDDLLANVKQAEGVEAYLALPAKRIFKVNVRFPLLSGESS